MGLFEKLLVSHKLCRGNHMENKLNIYDGEELLGTADVSEDGRWDFKVEDLSVRDYSFRAETFDGKVESNDWAVTVQQPPLYEDFESGPGGRIGNNTSMGFPTMTVSNNYLGGPPMVIEVAAYFATPPMITGRSINIRGTIPNNYVALTLAREARVVKFGIRSDRKVRTRISYFSASGVLLSDELSPEYGAATAVWVEFSPPSPYEHELIKRISFSSVGNQDVSVDNVTMFV